MDLVFTPGKRLMGLTKPELMTLVNNKIGPCFKMENLLSLLKVFIYYFILWLNVVHLERGHLPFTSVKNLDIFIMPVTLKLLRIKYRILF